MSFSSPIKVTGHYTEEDNSPSAGSLEAVLSAPMKNGTQEVGPTPLAAAFDSEGKVSLPLLPTDDTGTSPTGIVYKFTIRQAGAQRHFYAPLPHAKAPEVDITYLEEHATEPEPKAPAQALLLTEKNAAGGVAGLDGTGHLMASEAPLQYTFAPTAASFETFSRDLIATAKIIVEGLQLSAIQLPSGFKLSRISLPIGRSFPETHWWFALFDAERHMLAATADQHEAAPPEGSAATLDIATVASGAATSYTTTTDGLYYLGFYFDALEALGNVGGTIAWKLPPVLCGASAGAPSTPSFPFQAAVPNGEGRVYGYVD